jgi:lysyl-tRNA synthetase class 2
MTEQPEHLNEEHNQHQQRLDKLQSLRQQGQAYPNHFRPNMMSADVHREYDTLYTQVSTIKVAGRMLLRRIMGRASFCQLHDMSGNIQIYVQETSVGQAAYATFQTWDIGDILAITGNVFKTKTGEISIKATHIELLTKSLQPMADKWHGLADQELRYRRRYLDLIANPASKQIFHTRSKIIRLIRQFLEQQRFLEVETPMMHPIPGGAAARPFITHHNTLDMPLYLRIAPELYLKRLVVGGLDRVYEINRNFRNEGVSSRHNPEFTMLEFYQAYASFTELMHFTEQLFQYLVEQLGEANQCPYDLSKPFTKLTMLESISKYYPNLTPELCQNRTALQQYLRTQQLPCDDTWSIYKLQFEVFTHAVEPHLMEPTFITAYPKEVSPLARSNDMNPELTDRFELFIGGNEIANGFSELNDPMEQAARFQAQTRAREAGDLEAMYYDADYVKALEYGLPPTAGEGIGIDRLVMLFTNAASIREVILFPQLKQQV